MVQLVELDTQFVEVVFIKFDLLVIFITHVELSEVSKTLISKT